MEDTEILEELLVRARRLESNAIGDLFDRYHARVFRFFYFRTSSQEDAEDLANDVFVRVVKNIRRQKGNFEAWLFRIARNILTDYYRRNAIRKEKIVNESMMHEKKETNPPERADFTIDELKGYMRTLTEEQQQVILLKFVEGYDNAAIADIMNKTVGAVKALQFRGLSLLRESLEMEM